MFKNYNPLRPSDVRQFSQEIARLMASGPAGVLQAEQWIKELSKSASGKDLLEKAHHNAKIYAQTLGIDFKNVKIHAGANADLLKQELSAQAFTAGQDIFFDTGESGSKSPSSAKLLAHELAHVVQQSSDKGMK